MYEILNQARVVLWMVLHHRWLSLAVTVLFCVVGWIGIYLVPDKYEVTAKVYLDTETVLTPLLKGLAIDNSVREQSAMVMRRTLLTRPNLMQVMRATDLDLTVDGDAETEALMLSLLKRLRVTGHNDRRRQDANIYTITFYDKDPQLAKSVVEALLNVFLENTLGITKQDASKAQAFLDQQIEEYEARLEKTEDALKEFKRSHVGKLPGESGNFFARLESAKSLLSEAQLQLAEARRRLADLDAQLRKVNRTLSAGRRSGVTTTPVKSPLEERQEALQQRLDGLLLQYTDQHPDVIATRDALRQIKAQRQQTRDEAGVTEETQAEAEQLALNPVYQDLTVARSEVKAAIAALEARVAAYQAKVDDLQANITVLPEIENQYTKLVRDYNVTKTTYDQLVSRRESAQISQQADESGDPVQFRIVEPPVAPTIPTGPNRPLLVTAVLFGALGAGIGAAWLLAQLRPCFYTRDQLVADLGLPVLGTVSMIWSNQQIAARRTGILLFGMASVMVLVGYVVALIPGLRAMGLL